MKARVKWIENVCFIGESESNHSVILDGPEELGGRKLGMRPMEMLLIGMGGCTSFDVDERCGGKCIKSLGSRLVVVCSNLSHTSFFALFSFTCLSQKQLARKSPWWDSNP